MQYNLSEDQKIKLLKADDVYRIMQEILIREDKIDIDKEHFWMIGLEANYRILYIELVSMGSVTATVEPMNVYRVAVMKGAVYVIMVHNHPTGEVHASEEDKDMTDRLIQVGRILNIQAIDHLIISPKTFLSFADIGLMDELEQSTKWVPQFELIARIKAEEKVIRDEAIRVAREQGLNEGVEKGMAEGTKLGEEIGEQRGLAKGKREIARQMKRNQEPLEKIVEYTGLSEAEILEL